MLGRSFQRVTSCSIWELAKSLQRGHEGLRWTLRHVKELCFVALDHHPSARESGTSRFLEFAGQPALPTC